MHAALVAHAIGLSRCGRVIVRKDNSICAGGKLTLICGAPLTPAQWQSLATTELKFDCVRFHPEDAVSGELLLNHAILVSIPSRQNHVSAGFCSVQEYGGFN